MLILFNSTNFTVSRQKKREQDVFIKCKWGITNFLELIYYANVFTLKLKTTVDQNLIFCCEINFNISYLHTYLSLFCREYV